MGKKRDKKFEAGTSSAAVEPKPPTKVQKVSKEHIAEITFFQFDDNAVIKTFPATLTSAERKAIHHYATRMGLKTKSVGKGTWKYIPTSYDEMNVIVLGRAVLY